MPSLPLLRHSCQPRAGDSADVRVSLKRGKLEGLVSSIWEIRYAKRNANANPHRRRAIRT
jgi:hypothetical protein